MNTRTTILLAVALGLLCVVLWGCTPNANFAAYGSAFNGQFNRSPYYYPAPYYYPQPWQSQWMGPPRVSCFPLGQFVRCQQI